MQDTNIRHKADAAYSATTKLGICRNCGRHMPMVAGRLCHFCERRKDDPALARRQVQDWIEAGMPIPLGSFVRWRWKPVEEIGLTVRASRTDSPAPMV
jgi:hypothetical protein